MGVFVLIRVNKNGDVINVWHDEDFNKLQKLERYLEINDGSGCKYFLVDTEALPDMSNKSR
jgi:hypothetical protein